MAESKRRQYGNIEDVQQPTSTESNKMVYDGPRNGLAIECVKQWVDPPLQIISKALLVWLIEIIRAKSRRKQDTYRSRLLESIQMIRENGIGWHGIVRNMTAISNS